MIYRLSVVGSGLADGGSNIRWATGVVFVCAAGWVGPSIWGQIFCLGEGVNRLLLVLAVLFSRFSRWRIRRWLGRTFESILSCQERFFHQYFVSRRWKIG
jgi:uncharacterized membrane protein